MLATGPSRLARIAGRLLARGDYLAWLAAQARRHGDLVRLGPGCVLVNGAAGIDRVLYATHDELTLTRDSYPEDVARFWGGALPMALDPEDWRRRRRLIQPVLNREHIAEFVKVMADQTDRCLSAWRPGTVDVYRELREIALAIACRTLLGVAPERGAPVVGPALRALMEVLEHPELKSPKPGRLRRHLAERLEALHAFLDPLIAERRAQGAPGADVLAGLLRARDAEGRGFSDEDVRDDLSALLRAAYKNNAISLAWALHLVSQDETVAARLEVEVDREVAGLVPAPAETARLAYTRAVVAEAVRLYPVYATLTRAVVGDFSVGDTPLPRGTVVVISPWLAHRDPRHFDEPETFRPERWLGDLERRLPRGAYVPFGGGPRVCNARGYALMESTTLLAALVRRFRFRPAGRVKGRLTANGYRPEAVTLEVRPRRSARPELDLRAAAAG